MNKKELFSRFEELRKIYNLGVSAVHCESCEAGVGNRCKNRIFKYKMLTWHKCRVKVFSEVSKEFRNINITLDAMRREEREAREVVEFEKIIEEELSFLTEKHREIHVKIYPSGGKFKITQTKNTRNLHAGMKLPAELLSLIVDSSIEVITI